LIEFHDDLRVELYNVREDQGEQHNLASAEPNLVKSLRDQLHRWREDVQAQMPTRNPAYDPTKPEHIPASPMKKTVGRNKR
jgi:arylsulfatase A